MNGEIQTETLRILHNYPATAFIAMLSIFSLVHLLQRLLKWRDQAHEN
jgi:hypothetical protein